MKKASQKSAKKEKKKDKLKQLELENTDRLQTDNGSMLVLMFGISFVFSNRGSGDSYSLSKLTDG